MAMRLSRAGFLLGLLLHAVTGFAQSADFALTRLEAGKQAFAQRRFLEAIDDFRIAGFSVLDRPARLLECVARLALAQSAAGYPAEERKATLNRFLDLEERFRLYGEIDLEPETRQAFRALLRRSVSTEKLATFPELLDKSARRLPRKATTPSPSPVPVTAAFSAVTETSTATPTPTLTLTFSLTATSTRAPLAPTATPMRTDTPTPGKTAVPATETHSPTRTSTPTRTSVPPTVTPVPTDMPRPIAPSATRTPTRAPSPRRSKPATTVAAAETPSPVPDRTPRPVFSPGPAYPPADLKERIRGLVVLRVLVSETGVPVDVVIVTRALGHLTEAAVTAVRTWRFEPAIKMGRPVRAWTEVEIPFEALPYPTMPPSGATPTPSPGERRSDS